MSEKRYRVTSERRFHGHEPGSEFTATLTKGQEKRYLDADLIEVAQTKAKAAPAKDTKPAEPAEEKE